MFLINCFGGFSIEPPSHQNIDRVVTILPPGTLFIINQDAEKCDTVGN